jgi:hypothetical protein
VEDPLPAYFELQAIINAAKPTAGSKSNAFMIFDYQSPTDFKFAGVNISNNKLEMGHRGASGWIVDEQSNAQLKPDQDYNVLLSINGVTATLVVDNSEVFSHAFVPRVIDGLSFGLNVGMVGLGADNSSARIDNLAVQVLPPEITLEETEDFTDGVAQRMAVEAGTWQISADRYEGTPAGENGVSLIDLEQTLASSSVLELEATLDTGTIGGFVFDYYGPSDFKFVALSATTDELIIGHHARKGWVVDATAAVAINSGTDHDLTVSIKGTTVSVELDGQAVAGHVFNALAVDGDFGLLTRNGQSSFDSLTFRTDDPAFAG